MSVIRGIQKMVRVYIARAIASLYTNEVAQVVAFDKLTLLASVQPCVTRFRSADAGKLTGLKLPIMNDVSLKIPGSGNMLMSVAPKVGSYGALHFSDRCIEQWVQDGGIAPPRSARKLSMNDCWFDPGLYPQAGDGDNGAIQGGIEDDRISLRTRTGNTEISVMENETVHIATANGTVDISAAGDITLNGGSASVAREGDDTLADGSTDAVFIHPATGWVNLVSVAINTLAPGTIAVVPTSITGNVNEGSSTVKVP